MALSRRGFLSTLATALAGAAVFDPKSLLWVPAQPALAFRADALEIAMAPLSDSQIDGLISEQLELNELAQLFAREMTERLRRDKSLALREIMFRHTGSVHLPPGLLDVTDHGIGRFEPLPARLMIGNASTSRSAFINQVAHDMTARIASERLDCFAPIGSDLRQGEPWSKEDHMMVGLATNPDSGLSVRVLRYRQDARHGSYDVRTAVEMAGGRWKSIEQIKVEDDEAAAIARERARYDEYGDPVEPLMDPDADDEED